FLIHRTDRAWWTGGGDPFSVYRLSILVVYCRRGQRERAPHCLYRGNRGSDFRCLYELALHGCAWRPLWLLADQRLGLSLLEWPGRTAERPAALYPGNGHRRPPWLLAALADCGAGQRDAECAALPGLRHLPLAYCSGLGGGSPGA